MEDKHKIKVIIDTDPGVDDSVCLIYAFFDENIDIKLLTSVVGNVSIDIATRNLLHLVDLFGIAEDDGAFRKSLPKQKHHQRFFWWC